MNNGIAEIKSTLEGNNSRITEAKGKISEVEDIMVKINYMAKYITTYLSMWDVQSQVL